MSHLKKYLKTHQLSIGDHLYKVAAKVPQPILGLTNKNDQIHIMSLMELDIGQKLKIPLF
jgi:hypothetical protein